MLTTGEFQRERERERGGRPYPLIRGPRLGSSFKTHARLLSSGFCRRVYASLASRQRTRSSRTDVGPLCRGPRLFVYVSRPRLMALVRTLPPPPLHLRPDVLHLWNILKSPFRLDARSLDRPIPPPPCIFIFHLAFPLVIRDTRMYLYTLYHCIEMKIFASCINGESPR